jgi:hypothetical protein
MLYLTPGLVASTIAALAWEVLAGLTVRHFFLPDHPFPPEKSSKDFSTSIVLHLAFIAFGTVVHCPLDVMTVKLAIQRNHMTSEYNSVSQEAEVEKTTEYYASIFDAVK